VAFIMDVLARDDLPFPRSLPEFQRLFPDDAACAAYLEKARWSQGFVCPWCGNIAEPFRFENRPGVLRCRACRKDVGLTAGTVMEKSHTPLSVWFWAAHLVASQTPTAERRDHNFDGSDAYNGSTGANKPAVTEDVYGDSIIHSAASTRLPRALRASRHRGQGIVASTPPERPV
jgi:hypothetical protein